MTRVRRRLSREEFPALHAFLAGYLHEDFVQEHATPESAARAFHREATAGERSVLAREATRFLTLTESWPWADVRAALSELGSAWRPRSRAMLAAVLFRLTT